MKKQTEGPLIHVSVNWARWKHLIIKGIKRLISVGRKLGEFILKTILRILTLLVRLILVTYKALSKFAKSKQRGIWIIFLIMSILALVFYGRRVFVEQRQKYEELQFFHQKQIKETEKLIDEKHELENELEETKEKLEAKLNTPPTNAIARVVNNKPLSDELKQIIAKHADEYGVSRKYCECIITLESGGRPEATGDNGKAHGVAQYHLGTYLADAKRVGLPVQDDRRNPERAILAMVGALSRGEDSKWTVAKYCN